MKLTMKQRTRARRAAGLQPHDSRPVFVIPEGSHPPVVLGHPPYHTTPSGQTIVHHPNSYGWPTWYHPSTRRVVVGERWFDEQEDRA